MALEQRRPDHVIRHSDKGSQYTSLTFDTLPYPTLIGIGWRNIA